MQVDAAVEGSRTSSGSTAGAQGCEADIFAANSSGPVQGGNEYGSHIYSKIGQSYLSLCYDGLVSFGSKHVF